jgi:hypothetical protein
LIKNGLDLVNQSEFQLKMRNLENVMTDVVEALRFSDPLKYHVRYGPNVPVIWIYDYTGRMLKVEIVQTDGYPVGLVMSRSGFTRREMEEIMDMLMEKLSPDDGNAS